MPVWIQVLVWVGLLALLGLVAFGLRRAQQGTVQPGDTIPDFTLTLFDGYQYAGKSEVKFSELRGKVVVINFWASWCKPCEQEAAELETAWRDYQDDERVVFLGIDYTDTPTPALGYLTKFEITYPNSPDLGSRVSQLFRIKGVPETYFVDPDGKLSYVQVGPFASAAEIHSIIDPLLKP
jgi:cytochrome c biogenesis protein CcmG/thiol:disulfide interchange protein DsbE